MDIFIYSSLFYMLRPVTINIYLQNNLCKTNNVKVLDI